MAYYGRRGGYRSGYRRGNPKALFKLITLIIFVAAVALAVIQTTRAQKIALNEKKLADEVNSLQSKLEIVQNYVPAYILEGKSETALAYQKLYPEMMAERPQTLDEIDKRAIYLTFEGGPSENTEDILDYLKNAGQKATFFITCENIQGNEAIIKRISDEGHTVGICSYSTDYKTIYQSVDAFLADFNKAYTAIYDACGVYPSVFRFPCGSINEYNSSIYRELISEMTRRGFVFFDWNVNSDDNGDNEDDWEAIVQDVANDVKDYDQAIVLMHDSEENSSTARAVKYMLNYLGKNGYYFANIKSTTVPVTFDYFE